VEFDIKYCSTNTWTDWTTDIAKTAIDG
jgi:hypothetical protein